MSTERQESKLIRNIGFWPLMGIAYGQIIGAGIMTQTGIAIGMTGTGVVLAYIISAVCTTFQNFPTAILGATVPVSGGEYRYISRLRGKKWGFVYLATYVVSKLTIALYALSCASYLVAFLTGISEQIIAICLLVAAFAINLLGTKQSAFVTTGITALLLLGMALFLFYGLPKTDIAYVFDPSNLMAHGPGNLLSAIALLSFATGGAQVIGNMGSEIIDPQKNMPKVIIISTVTVGIMYALVAMVASGVLPLEVVSNQNLSLVAADVMPGWAFTYFTLAAGAGATAKTLNVTLSWSPKPILIACDDGMLPRSWGTVSKRGVPYKILIAFFFIGLIPLLAGMDISLISKMGTAISLLSKLMFSYAFLNLPKKYPEAFARSEMKVSEGTVKILGYGSMILSAIFSASLIIDLPTAAKIGFVILFAASIAWANSGKLDKIEIPNDLDVQYVK
ncbi:APC family permease [Hydrogenoanaerobacterium saccharovorans]|uniref:APC family permease n=1 Tax=Hydrogenoanaerobacterium saccharovorans TaxID=474960 RepID=A0ABS2GNA0_9FIRM|nr:APC family permease [Hydrogenoanaerobacterium saccharovorans]MBM6922955.1 APC family permease [Hydrogenoanaerobacterium saccharovorans]